MPKAESEPKPKNIVLLSDGTGNSSASLFRTNVWRIYEALDLSETGKTNGKNAATIQVASYGNGVGTSAFRPWAILSSALGVGVKNNVCQIYSFLCRHYEPGDKIFCFGFSRGAYTMRMVMALIGNQGIMRVGRGEGEIDPENMERFATMAYRSMKREVFRKNKNPLLEPVRNLRDYIALRRNRRYGLENYRTKKDCESGEDCHPKRHDFDNTEIEFAGLFDTVAAYGLPIDELTRGWGQYFWPLVPLDWNIGEGVKKVCHALAMNDNRHTFHPKQINERADTPTAEDTQHGPNPFAWENDVRRKDKKGQCLLLKDEAISQVWFPGAHSNIGGGYPDDGLAMHPLLWIICEAERHGLRFQTEKVSEYKEALNPKARLYNPRRALGGTYRYNPRDIHDLCNDKNEGIFVKEPKIHHSVFKRIRRVSDYSPFVLPKTYSVVDENGALLRAGCREGDDPGDKRPIADPALYENDEDARRRWFDHQPNVWDTIWLRRVVYFLSIIPGILLLSMPLTAGAAPDQSCVGWACGLSLVVDAADALTPDLLSPWWDAFRAQFDLALLYLCVGAALILWGSRLQTQINWALGRHWESAIRAKGKVDSPASESGSRWIRKLRTSDRYKGFMKVLTRKLLPVVFIVLVGILAIAALLVLASRIAFWGQEQLGFICESSAQAEAEFNLKDDCNPTIYFVEEGHSYQVTIVPKERWKDNDIPASPAGIDYAAAPWYMKYAVPLRRTISEKWFQPMMRVGDSFGHEYPLLPEPGATKTGEQDQQEFVSSFLARRDGPVYFYVNDAVIAGPREMRTRFYSNNEGTGTISLCRIMTNEEKKAKNKGAYPLPEETSRETDINMPLCR